MISGYVTTQGTTIDFISLMLAKPNCLVALALYHNDFSKANQIIEVCYYRYLPQVISSLYDYVSLIG